MRPERQDGRESHTRMDRTNDRAKCQAILIGFSCLNCPYVTSNLVHLPEG